MPINTQVGETSKEIGEALKKWKEFTNEELIMIGLSHLIAENCSIISPQLGALRIELLNRGVERFNRLKERSKA